MTLPELKDWQDTRQGLHQAAQILSAVRRVVATPESNWTHLGLTVTAAGLTTGATDAGELVLDFARRQILAASPAGVQQVFDLVGQTQQTLAVAVEAALQVAGYDGQLDHEKLAGNTALTVDPGLAADYAAALYLIWGALDEVRVGLDGYTTRLVVWGHGFDAAFLWFRSADSADEGKDPHVGIGFSPGSPGLDRPYFYTYVWPVAEGLTNTTLPALARWHTAGWTGAIIDYDAVRQEADAAAAIRQTLRQVFDAVAPQV